ncbi:uncharacterized protein BROUX77_007970 [Berkeleyomyces rouxiae]|uniref:uncharacterized protein n=1 Tax=Berkeleyomyces rouxiae TaxID=2035830 RepID=UPI003B794AA3
MFGAFSGSAVPKRLLRHALSRLDLLDTDAIDIDNLELAIGRNTVLEFRDVGLRLDKLERILRLPPALQIRQARVRLLRISIPIDFYTSPICVSVQAVEVGVSLETQTPSAPNLHDAAQQDVDEPLVPNATDLAQSFLDMQSLTQKRELELAISHKSTLAQTGSDDSSDGDGDDNESETQYGTGQPLSLPGFLAGFLQGIVDRVEVTISDVTFNFDIDLPTDHAHPANPRPQPHETVSFRLQLDSIAVEGITKNASTSSEPQPLQRPGKRHVAINKLRAYLISQPRILSLFSSSSCALSSTQSTVLSQNQDLASALAPHSYHGEDFLTGSPAASKHLSIDSHQPGLQPALDLTKNPPELQSTPDYGADQMSEDDPATPRQTTNLLDQSLTGSVESLPPFLELPTSSSSSPRDIGADAPAPTIHVQQPTESVNLLIQDSDDDPDYPAMPVYSRSSSSSDVGEDLTTSRMFTHNDAESLYMSAISLQQSEVSQHQPTPWLHKSFESPGDSASQESPDFLGPSSDVGSLAHFGFNHNSSPDGIFELSNTTSQAPPAPSHDISRVLAPEQSQTQPDVEQKSNQTSSPRASASIYDRSIHMPGGWGESTTDNLESSRYTSAFSISQTREPVTSTQTISFEALIPGMGVVETTTSATNNTRDEPPRPETPQGPPRMAKEILSLDMISIFIPSQPAASVEAFEGDSQQQEQPSGAVNPDASLHSGGPGAYSMYNTFESLPDINLDNLNTSTNSEKPCESIDIELSPLQAQLDTSLGFLLASMVSKLAGVFATASRVSTKSANSTQNKLAKSQDSPTAFPNIKFGLEGLSFLLVQNVFGFKCFSGKVTRPAESSPLAEPEVLLRADINDVSATMHEEKGKKVYGLFLGKVSFGYATERIVWFEQEALMQASIRDAFPDKGADVQVSLSQDKLESRIQVLTLPLCATINLVKMDELFEQFGGISGFVDLGLSMAARFPQNPQIMPQTKEKRDKRSSSVSMPISKSKGVRFEESDPTDQGSAVGPKTDIRIGGCRLRLMSRTCRFDVDTTSLKAVVRDTGVRSHISQIQLTGPRTHETQSVPITVQLSDTRVDFLNTPLESDISALLEMLMPTTTKFTDHDDLMVDTLFAQRRKGSLLRINTKSAQFRLGSLPALECLSDLGSEVGKFTPLAQMFPEDDRPGILVMANVDSTQTSVDVGGKIGMFHCDLGQVELAHVGFPSLLSVGIGTVRVDRNSDEVLIDSVRNIAAPPAGAPKAGMAIRIRMIGDDLEPVVRVRVQDVAIEYRVPMIMDLLGLEDVTPQEFEEALATSVANLGEAAIAGLRIETAPVAAPDPQDKSKSSKPLSIDLGFRDTLIGLNPLGIQSKLYSVLNECHIAATLPENGNYDAQINVSKAWLMLVDNVDALLDLEEVDTSNDHHVESWLTTNLSNRGFANISYISSAMATVKSVQLSNSEKRQILVDVKDTFFILETCADSMQTLVAISNALSPPTPPSTEVKYRTAIEVQDLLASISGDAFGRAEGDYDFENDFSHVPTYESGDSDYDNLSSMASSNADLRAGMVEDHDDGYYHSHGMMEPSMRGEKLFDASSMTDSITTTQDTHDGVLLGVSSAALPHDETYGTNSELVFDDNYFENKAEVAENARLWDAAKGSHTVAPKHMVDSSPVKVTVRNVRVFWNMFDGYDWIHTREVIADAVAGVQKKAMQVQGRHGNHDGGTGVANSGAIGNSTDMHMDNDDEDDDDLIEAETEIGDFLFNSIYIGVSPRQDPRELTNAINGQLGDTTDTESVFTTTTQTSGSTVRPSTSNKASHKSQLHQKCQQKLRLQRSRQHKISFEATGIDVDMAMLPAESGPTQSCIDVRVKTLDVIDHMPQSSWKKFATYDREAGEQEYGSNMIHLEVLNVKPVPELAASEFVISVEVLPLRLHVDQDALDFMKRFFAFKDDSMPIHQSTGDVPFISRFEIQRIPLKLDFKPRRVDYGALRSGKTSEFMNFVTLQDTRIELRRIMLHGVMGFDRVGLMLNDLWTPDVKRFQLSTVLAGLSLVRPLADVGSGFKDLIEIPMAEYRKDGRILRSIKKGALSFVRNTGTGVVKLGAKVAVGTQNALEGAESLLSRSPQPQEYAGSSGLPPGRSSSRGGAGGSAGGGDERQVISPYANQPLGVVQGLRGGYTSLARDITLAKDAIVAVSTQVMESDGPTGAAKAVLDAAPTIIFRPVIGTSKAIGQTLLGATNTLDPANRWQVDDKYK